MSLRKKIIALMVVGGLGGQVLMGSTTLAIAQTCELPWMCAEALAEEQGVIAAHGAEIQWAFIDPNLAVAKLFLKVVEIIGQLTTQLTGAEANQAVLRKYDTDAKIINDRTTAAAKATYQTILDTQPSVALCRSLTAAEEHMKAEHVAQAYQQSFDEQDQKQAVIVATTTGAQGAQLVKLSEQEKKYGPQVADEKMKLLHTNYAQIFGKPANTPEETAAGRVFVDNIAGPPVDVPKGHQLKTSEGLEALHEAFHALSLKSMVKKTFNEDLASKAVPPSGIGNGMSEEQIRHAKDLIYDLNAKSQSAGEGPHQQLVMLNASMNGLNDALIRIEDELEHSNNLIAALVAQNLIQYGREVQKKYPMAPNLTAELAPLSTSGVMTLSSR